jgi:hypothetical protein
MYVGVLTGALGYFFMAQFSSLETEAERGQMLRRTALQLLVVSACCALTILVFRDAIIAVVLTASFAPMRALLPFQLLGDVLKVVHYPLQMALASQRRVGSYIALTLLGPAIYVSLTELSRSSLGMLAAPAAYATSYGVVVLALLFMWRRTLMANVAAGTALQPVPTV